MKSFPHHMLLPFRRMAHLVTFTTSDGTVVWGFLGADSTPASGESARFPSRIQREARQPSETPPPRCRAAHGYQMGGSHS